MLEVKSAQYLERLESEDTRNHHLGQVIQEEVINKRLIDNEELDSKEVSDNFKNASRSTLDRTISLTAVLEPDTTLAVQQHKADIIQSHLNFLYKDRKLCDLVIKNDEKQFHIHSFALTMHSEKYKVIFTDSVTAPPTEILLPAVSSNIIDKVLEYMYTFNVDLNDGCIEGILDAAKQLDMKMLIKKSVEYLLKFDVSNVLRFLTVAKKHNFKGLTAQYLEFAKQNFHSISNLPEFNDISFDDLNVMIAQGTNGSIQAINERTATMLKSVIGWASQDVEVRSVQLARLLQNISLDRIEPRTLEDVLESAQFVLNIPECLQILRKAFRFHAISLTQLKIASSDPPITDNKKPQIELKPNVVVIGGLIDQSGCPYEKGTIVLQCSLYHTSEMRQWTEFKPLPCRRCGHCVVILKNHLYVLGGSIHEGDSLLPMPTRTVVRYSTLLKEWEKMPSMIVTRNEFAACATDSLIYVFGGETEEFCPTDTVEYFSPKTKRWTLACPMAIGRISHAACLHQDHIYVVGGRMENALLQFVDIYNFEENRWLPKAHFPVSICRGSLTELDGLMFYMGGVCLQGETVLASSEKIYQYEDDTEQWKVVGRLAIPRHLGTTAASGTEK